jgi:hypothetical protein
MKVSKAVNLFLDYHKMNSQKNYNPGFWINPSTMGIASFTGVATVGWS